jgi:hypothetical protein
MVEIIIVVVLLTAGLYALKVRDFVRDGRRLRNQKELRSKTEHENARVQCGACAELIRPEAHLCPYCRAVQPRPMS